MGKSPIRTLQYIFIHSFCCYRSLTHRWKLKTDLVHKGMGMFETNCFIQHVAQSYLKAKLFIAVLHSHKWVKRVRDTNNHLNMGIMMPTFRRSLLKAFMMVHLYVHRKRDGNVFIENLKKSMRERFSSIVTVWSLKKNEHWVQSLLSGVAGRTGIAVGICCNFCESELTTATVLSGGVKYTHF